MRVWHRNELLRDLKARGLTAPALAVCDGALGFWAGLRDVFSATAEQRCWRHKTANELNALPTRQPSAVREPLTAMYTAAGGRRSRRCRPSRTRSPKASSRSATSSIPSSPFRLSGRARHPPARDQSDRVDLRHRAGSGRGVNKGAEPRAAGLAMTFKLAGAARARSRRSKIPTWWLSSAPAPGSSKGQLPERREEPKGRSRCRWVRHQNQRYPQNLTSLPSGPTTTLRSVWLTALDQTC